MGMVNTNNYELAESEKSKQQGAGTKAITGTRSQFSGLYCEHPIFPGQWSLCLGEGPLACLT